LLGIGPHRAGDLGRVHQQQRLRDGGGDFVSRQAGIVAEDEVELDARAAAPAAAILLCLVQIDLQGRAQDAKEDVGPQRLDHDGTERDLFGLCPGAPWALVRGRGRDGP